MIKKLKQKLKTRINNLKDRLQITTILRTMYFKLAPYGTRRYKISRKLLRGIFNNFRLLNIRYQYWIKHFDTIDQEEIQQITENIRLMSEKPLLSVIMPVFNPDIKHLEKAIASVQNQIYPHWELCIADDASTKPGIREVIQKYIKADQRIKAVFREENGHISAASNTALDIASGEYIVLLDHDDKLHPLALYYVAQEISSHPESEVIYSDEDKLTGRGKRIDPYFKSDFDYELLLCQNMVSHLGVYKTATVRKIGGFRIGLEGSQDYDLLLRVIEQIERHQIRHIPKVLYHWRISKQSVATSVDVKPYALEAGAKALQDHLSNQEINAEVKTYKKYGYEINYAIPDPEPYVTCFIKTKQASDLLIQSLYSLFENTGYENLKLYVTIEKNQRDDHLLESIRKINPNQINFLFNEGPSDYLEIINPIIKNEKADFLGFLDSACMSYSDRWLETIISIASNTSIGAVSPKLVYESKLIHSCGVILGVNELPKHLFNGVSQAGPDYYFGWSNLNKGYSALPAGCILVNRAKFQLAGGFNFDCQNDNARIIDLSLKLKELGLRNIMTPNANIIVSKAQTQATTKSNGELIISTKDKKNINKRWEKWVKNDPAFNPNLTIHHGKPMVKNP